MSPAPQSQIEPVSSRGWRILLINANRCTIPEPVFPLGLAHLSAVLRDCGHQVDWLDCLVEGENFEQRLIESQPDLVGISVRNIDDVIIRRQETFVEDLESLVDLIHERLGCSVVLGGSGFSIMPREIMEMSGADYGIVGEGEAVLPALIEALATRSDFSSIPGLVFRRSAVTEVNARGRHAPQTQLRTTDMPSKVAAYYLQNGGILNLQTQRGCAHRCCYCTYPVIEGTRHRRRPADEVVAEFEHLENLGARYAFVVDSVFNSSEAHVHAICEELARRKLKIRWGCFLRPQGLTAEMVRLMALAGLEHIEFGCDSFCDEVLQAYQKDFSFEDIRLSTDLVSKADINFCHFLIAGGPGETLATLQQGFENSRSLGNAVIMAVPGMRIYPGTALFERAAAEGRLDHEANLIQPAYYLAPGLTVEVVLETLNRFAAQSPNWIVGDFDPGYQKLVSRLRKRGVTGPLWSYFATAQRLWPQHK